VKAWLVDPRPRPRRLRARALRSHGSRTTTAAVWASNTNRQTLLRIPDHSHRALPDPSRSSPATCRASTTSSSSRTAPTWRSSHSTARTRSPWSTADGTSKGRPVRSADGLDSPTDTAIRGDRIFITDGGGAAPTRRANCKAERSTSQRCSAATAPRSIQQRSSAVPVSTHGNG